MTIKDMISRKLCQVAMSASVAAACIIFAASPDAQTNSPDQETQTSAHQQYRDLINSNTVTILGASLSGSYIKFLDDIARAVNDGHNLRVLPIIGEGGSQNIRDILYLKGVDAGIVMSTSLDSYNGKPLFENLQNRLQYIARLYEEEFHIIGGKDIGSVADLAGKKVGFHGGAHVSGQELLAKLKIEPAEAIKVDFFEGLEQIRRGEISAIIRATASPMDDLNDKFDPEIHRMVSIPFEDALIESHLPGKLTHKHYPKIIAEGQTVETAAIGVVLAVYPWQPGTDRYRRVAKFTDALFSNVEKLLADPNRHPKWDDVNLAAKLPGWTRFPAAEEWLQKSGRQVPTASASLQSNFSTFLQSKAGQELNDEQKEALFREFQKWRDQSAQ
jgi:TRAP-type uncharacterized transport system substrate-binding protein